MCLLLEFHRTEARFRPYPKLEISLPDAVKKSRDFESCLKRYTLFETASSNLSYILNSSLQSEVEKNAAVTGQVKKIGLHSEKQHG